MVKDRSSIHTSRAVKRCFEAHSQNFLLDWPPKGADCNPIENLCREKIKGGGEETWTCVGENEEGSKHMEQSNRFRAHPTTGG